MLCHLYNRLGQELLEGAGEASCTEDQHNATDDKHIGAQGQGQNSQNGNASDGWVSSDVCRTTALVGVVKI